MALLEVHGAVDLPGDKSISHRALILSALATGTSEIQGLLCSADTAATAGVLRALGWRLPPLAPQLRVIGGGLRRRGLAAPCEAPCHNSGTTARLMMGVAAAQARRTTFSGDASLQRRPMQRVTDPLRALGATVEWLGTEGTLPTAVTGGALNEIRWPMEVASAQVKSAILLAALCGGVPVAVREVAPTRDHTERMLRALGVTVALRDGWITQEPSPALPASSYHVPGDPSSAVFFAALAAGASRGSITLRQVLLNPRRVGFLKVMERMGVVFDVHDEQVLGGEAVGDVVVNASHLRGVDIGPSEIPDLIDEVPMLSVLAAVAEGDTRVTGAQELRTKESDRIARIVQNLRNCGIEAEELADGLVVRGGGRVRPTRIETGSDHRVAMSFAILSALSGTVLEIDQPSCVDVSYPSFWRDLAHLVPSAS